VQKARSHLNALVHRRVVCARSAVDPPPRRRSHLDGPLALVNCKRGAFIAFCVAAFTQGGCAGSFLLDAAGPGARSIAELTWVLLLVMTLIAVIVLGLLGYAALHRRKHEPDTRPRSDRPAIRWVLFGGLIAPAVILVALFVFIMRSLGVLARTGETTLTIEVTGRQWWWQVDYPFSNPSLNVRTANEIHIPVGQRVQLVLKSVDVVHSLWVPELQGKVDLVPGRENRMWLEADRPGAYRGQCAEFCGLQHTRMALFVVAHSEAEFDLWLARQRAPSATPEDSLQALGQQVFLRNPCAICHTIRGTQASGTLAPDLTHLAARRSLAAGTLPNTRGHLGGWISDPQRVKPGTQMPVVPVPAAELTALIAYLESLR
jgi:cytochrome c oxidase subunit 2